MVVSLLAYLFVASPTALWEFGAGDRIFATPAVQGNTAWIGTNGGKLIALDLATGKPRWQFETKGPIHASPAVADGLVFCNSYDGNLYAIDAETGAKRWSFSAPGERRFEAPGLHGASPRTQTFWDPFDPFASRPAIANGFVYFGSGNGNVYALDAATGSLKWKFATGNVVHASPAIAGGNLYVGSFDSVLYALDAATGAEKWRYQAGRDDKMHNQEGFQASPIIFNGTVFNGCRDAQFYAFDARTGRKLWQVDNKLSWVVGTAARYKDGILYGTSDSERLRLLDAKTGGIRWETRLKGFIFASPAVAADTAWVATMFGNLYSIDLASGKILSEWKNPESRLDPRSVPFNPWLQGMVLAFENLIQAGAIAATPVPVPDGVLIATSNGRVYLLR